MNDLIEGTRHTGEILLDGEDIYRPRHRRGRPAPARRHGVSEVEPVPQVDLRERRLRPARGRRARPRPCWTRSSSAACSRPALWDEVKDRLQRLGARPVRRPAAAAVHRPRPGDRSGSAAAWTSRPRALDPASTARIEDLIFELKTRLHHRHRHAQHAAGGPRLRPDGVLLPGPADRDRPDRPDVHAAAARSRPKTTSPGRFG